MRRLSVAAGSLLSLVVANNTLAADIFVRTYDLGQAVADAVIQLNGKGLGSSNEKGEFKITGLAKDNHRLSVYLNGVEERIKLPLEDNEIAYVTVTADESSKLQSGVSVKLISEPENPVGYISGLVVNGQGEKIHNAQVTTANGLSTKTDTEGNYTLELSTGTYDLNIARKTEGERAIPNVVVMPYIHTSFDVILEKPSDGGLVEEMVVRSRFRSQTSINIERDAKAVMDVIDIADISRIGDTDIASALTRVSSVSLEGDKFAVVRGLNGRYVTTTINGARFAGTDPYRRDIALDLFPAFIVSNLQVQKSFTANVSGESTAANIDINSAKLPDQGFFKYSISTTGVENTTGEDVNDHYGSDSDWLGYDDGLRDRPELVQQTTGLSAAGIDDLTALNEQVAESFDPRYSVTETKARPNMSFGFSGGTTFDFGDGAHSWGFLVGARYSNRWWDRRSEQSINATYREQFRDPNGRVVTSDEFSVFSRGTSAESRVTNNISSGGLFSIGANLFDGQEVTLNSMVLRDSDKVTDVESGTAFCLAQGLDGDECNFGEELFNETDLSDEISQEIERVTLEWVERQTTLNQITGNHPINLTGSHINWMVSRSESSFERPDQIIYGQNIEFASRRVYEDLQDTLREEKIDFNQLIFDWGDYSLDLNLGYSHYSSDRGFTRFTYGTERPEGSVPNQVVVAVCVELDCVPSDPSNGFTPASIGANSFLLDWSNEGPSNIGLYNAESELESRYASLSFASHFVDVDFGIREEIFEQSVVPFEQPKAFSPSSVAEASQGTSEETIDPSELASDDELFSFNATIFPEWDTQIRLSYYETIARPSLTEAADGAFRDEDLGLLVQGNPNIQVTNIRNQDIRIEHFFSDNESVSLSFFRKTFTNPIELQLSSRSNETSRLTFQYRNFESGLAKGAELDFKKIMRWGSHELLFQGNYSRLESELVDFNDVGNEDRQMTFQPDYLMNILLGYDNLDTSVSSSIIYSRTGEKNNRLIDPRFDYVKEASRGVLKLVTKKTFDGQNASYSLSFSVDNVLRNEYRETFEAIDQFRSFRNDRRYQLKLNVSY